MCSCVILQKSSHEKDLLLNISTLSSYCSALDGAFRGHLRTNACGANLNREWCTTGDYVAPTLERSPEVYHGIFISFWCVYVLFLFLFLFLWCLLLLVELSSLTCKLIACGNEFWWTFRALSRVVKLNLVFFILITLLISSGGDGPRRRGLLH